MNSDHPHNRNRYLHKDPAKRCRCEVCKADNTAYMAKYRLRQKKKKFKERGYSRIPKGYSRLPAHGTYRRYNHRILKCRCDPCKEANTRHKQEWKTKRAKA